MLSHLYTTTLTSYSVRTDGLNQLSGYLQNVALYTGKRPYLEDRRPFMDALTAKNLTLSIAKAAIMPLNLIVNDYNTHTIANMEKEDEEEEFDWQGSYDKHKVKFVPTACKMVTVSILRKAFEEIADQNFTKKFVDRLTKDLSKSMKRKLARESSRLVVAQKVFWTAMHSNLIFNLSALLYDLSLYFLQPLLPNTITLQGQQEGVVSLPQRVQLSALFVGKKCTFYTVCLTSGALGASVGSVINLPYSGVACSLVFELLASVACSVLLNI
ncbi:hypothetical protein B484DRAFT_396746 [Ochromonadaceae sp. CCMP2298]|nr:hypothetical protein B484DRAFT_396746 [Ochromonadaceae sp. CCMP2298]|mmetsp:Transcript_16786/g.37257  ORF Transcript_16786/g.37257 Transcript_16786/m.37257 type:complete len:270 (+) Transcript_16786:110-919(+)|eukprot:CAMPEP_0173190798 /NCGR_PEP_ID=MMETSP1141-20130122/12539_1 /TAXON_ID=483371 /ORGANISM="non described non described, Strain CCMP2298" /LENGTH=269 /DNA_ID=CAMNT_0014114935 /DNA_START=19 /DNA_END=828 /DNA_ORIENTATION=-